MAVDAIKIRIIATVNNEELPSEPPMDVTADYDQATPVVERGIQIVGTTHEAIRLGDVTTAGAMVLRNLDDENFVEIGRVISAAFEPFDTIGPGEARVIKPPSGVTLYAKADTDSVRLNRFIPST
jgi:hypothetical protein